MQKDRYRKGAHTVTELKYHYVWKTKYSYNILKGDLALRLRDIIVEICAEKKINIEKGNVRANHVHILVSAPSYLSPAKMAQYLKGKSSYRLQREFRVCPTFYICKNQTNFKMPIIHLKRTYFHEN